MEQKWFPDAKVLEVDLSKGTIKSQVLPGEIYRLYPGGSALGTYLLLRTMKSKVDPLSEDNVITFSVSPLVGLPISGANRLSINTKSPLTGGIGDSQSGGFFAAHLKSNGWDSIVVRGCSPKPVYLYIDEDHVELKDATSLWGKVTGEVERAIKDELRDNHVEIAQIGPAGEKKVRFACVINMANRANGRNGTGAVMGSKNLKAIVVKRKAPQRPFDGDGFKSLVKKVTDALKDSEAHRSLHKYGTAGILASFNSAGYLPSKNWTSGYLHDGFNISGQAMTKTILKREDTCFGCAVKCKRVVEVPGKIDSIYGGPEYESCAALGSYCGVTDLEAVAYANQLCNMYGMDTISCGATIAFAMECFESGIIDTVDTEGIELNFGNGSALVKMVEKIAKREGFGGILAEGSAKAAKIIGRGSEKLLVTVKGQEFPAHMPQWKAALGLIYAINSYGADHQSSEHDHILAAGPTSEERNRLAKIGVWKGSKEFRSLDEEKVRFAFNTHCFYYLMNTLCLCQFIAGPGWQIIGPSEVVELCRSGIGWDTSVYELMLIGERQVNMMRFFNSREGFTKDNDTLPEKVFIPLSGGPSDGVHLDREELKSALEMFYEVAQWDPSNGNPTEGALRRLSLGWLLS